MKHFNLSNHVANSPTPPRFLPGPLWQYILWLCFLVFLVTSIEGTDIAELTFKDLIHIPKQVLYVLDRMFPPSPERISMVGKAMLQTLEMALIGNLVGIPISFILAMLCARNLTPHPVVYYFVRALVTFLRTTPSLVWAIFMIVAVGLGPKSGTVTLTIATIGFCSRFFAESMEEVDPGPKEALTSIGASPIGAIFCAVLPAATPAFINTALFNLEHTTRSSAVLGIVGAGGIGIELMVSIKTFHYDEAATILIFVFVMVMGVEQLCAWIRLKVLSFHYV